MSEVEEDFRVLMERVRKGSDEAAREVFDRYSAHISRVVRRQLHQRLRSQYDSLDFLQAVWASFFALPPDQYRFHRSEELIGFLSRMAYNKVVDVARRRFAGRKDNVNREQPLAWQEDRPQEVPAHQATPSQEVMAEERWQKIIEGQEPPLRRALEMLRQGHTQKEVSEATGLHAKALQRWLQRLTARWGML